MAYTHHIRRFIPLAFVLIIAAGSVCAKAQEKRGDAAGSRLAWLGSVKIYYMNYGQGGEALVLIHGWTQSIDAWRDQIPELAKRNRVIAIDLPGHGESDKPDTKYSMDYFARAVEAVMRDAKVKRAVLVGHSMGTP